MKQSLFRTVAIAGALFSASLGAFAQSYPTKTVTIVAPFSPGGSADGIARVIARELG
ncbi:hypothetical protein ACPWT1_07980 [Ramlibacter sp. MMS24-I3-19]|uniref:hypothetical protein n=1 Tax=Ramlibacter sp. MMS24-I3-19 TaxID=3416606 RepID=UPI003D026121